MKSLYFSHSCCRLKLNMHVCGQKSSGDKFNHAHSCAHKHIKRVDFDPSKLNCIVIRFAKWGWSQNFTKPDIWYFNPNYSCIEIEDSKKKKRGKKTPLKNKTDVRACATVGI